MKNLKKIIIMCIMFIGLFTLVSCEEKEVKYTDSTTASDEALLVLKENYYVGKGKMDGVIRYRFQVQKNNETSFDIDVREDQIKINSDNVDNTGKVFAYERTYTDGTKKYIYELFVQPSQIKDVGDLGYN